MLCLGMHRNVMLSFMVQALQDPLYVHCKKMLAGFPSPAGTTLTKLFLAGKNLLFPSWESLVSDIPAGDGKTANLFDSVAVPKLQVFPID
jgi:hypothetical protein